MGKTQQLAQGTVNRFKIQSDTQAELSKGEQGLKLRFFFQGAQSHLISFIKVLRISSSTSLDSLQKFEGGTGYFKGALGSQLQLISSPGEVSGAHQRFDSWARAHRYMLSHGFPLNISRVINPLMLTAAKHSLTILMPPLTKKHFKKYI